MGVSLEYRTCGNLRQLQAPDGEGQRRYGYEWTAPGSSRPAAAPISSEPAFISRPQTWFRFMQSAKSQLRKAILVSLAPSLLAWGVLAWLARVLLAR